MRSGSAATLGSSRFDRDIAIELGMATAVYLAHTTHAKRGDDFK